MKKNNYLSKSFLFPLITILFIAFFLMTFRLGRDNLLDWDECIYGQYAKEMFLSKNYFYHTWNSVINFEKPPLFAINQQFALQFGINEFTMRLGSVLGSMVLLITVYTFTWIYINPQAAPLAILILLSTKMYILLSTVVTTDLMFCLYIFLGFLFWRIDFFKRSEIISGIFFGLAVLQKGFSVVFFLTAVFLFVLFQKNWKQFRRYMLMLLIFLVTVLPWHIYMISRFGQPFIQEYFFDNLLTRSTHYLTPQNQHILVYAFYLAVDFFPWNLSLLIALKKKIFQEKIIWFMIFIPLTLFSIVKTRIFSYAFPIYPFFAIVCAAGLYSGLHRYKKVYILVICLIALKALFTIQTVMKLNQSGRINNTRMQVYAQIKNLPTKDIYYLVQSQYRDVSKKTPTLIPYHTKYGATPCVVYYGDKKTHVYYDVKKFEKDIQKQNIYGLVENSDKQQIQLKSLSTIYENNDYTLFQTK